MRIQPATPRRQWPTYERGTMDQSRNATKRRERSQIAKLKGQPGGWKRALRIQQGHSRPVLVGGVAREKRRLRGMSAGNRIVLGLLAVIVLVLFLHGLAEWRQMKRQREEARVRRSET
jgi:hypothetical protein